MNKIMQWFAIFLVAVMVNCGKEQMVDTDLVGSWQSVQSYYSPGGPGSWHDVENGHITTFSEDGTFTTDGNTCGRGSYSFDGRVLTLDYSCVGFLTGLENDENQITFGLAFQDNHFVLTSTSGPICIEGCMEKYLRK